jgi:EAL domain-containing protein (putative c-di-GMP-specific phosphodiesterase class I)
MEIWREQLRIKKLSKLNTTHPQITIDIETIIRLKSLKAYFQPIFSVTGKKAIGIEGLIRGIDPFSGEIISPKLLFDTAYAKNLGTRLDRICREKILAAFKPIHQQNPDLLLFLNLDTTIIDDVGGSNYLNMQVAQNGIREQNIVIEINESKAQHMSGLTEFVSTYKNYGFLIALDDVGAGFSNMNRITLLKPDIIKIDRSIIHKMDKIYHQQEVFKSLVNLSVKIGALIIAEGVETKKEAVEVLKLGAQVIQGFYFEKPQPDYIPDHTMTEKTDGIVVEYKGYLQREMDDFNEKYFQYTKLVNRMIRKIISSGIEAFDFSFLNNLSQSGLIDCAYILDEFGIQCSDTISSNCLNLGEKLVFQSAEKGVDHSIKNFYFRLTSRQSNTHITEPYVSMATGRLCTTYSKVFLYQQKKHILCVDFLESRRFI